MITTQFPWLLENIFHLQNVTFGTTGHVNKALKNVMATFEHGSGD